MNQQGKHPAKRQQCKDSNFQFGLTPNSASPTQQASTSVGHYTLKRNLEYSNNKGIEERLSESDSGGLSAGTRLLSSAGGGH